MSVVAGHPATVGLEFFNPYRNWHWLQPEWEAVVESINKDCKQSALHKSQQLFKQQQDYDHHQYDVSDQGRYQQYFAEEPTHEQTQGHFDPAQEQHQGHVEPKQEQLHIDPPNKGDFGAEIVKLQERLDFIAKHKRSGNVLDRNYLRPEDSQVKAALTKIKLLLQTLMDPNSARLTPGERQAYRSYLQFDNNHVLDQRVLGFKTFEGWQEFSKRISDNIQRSNDVKLDARRKK